jgi:dynactin complex subunit
MKIFEHIIISFLNKKTVEVLVGPVSMWITYFLQWKHSLSTCGQTVYKLVQVIHIFLNSQQLI